MTAVELYMEGKGRALNAHPPASKPRTVKYTGSRSGSLGSKQPLQWSPTQAANASPSPAHQSSLPPSPPQAILVGSSLPSSMGFSLPSERELVKPKPVSPNIRRGSSPAHVSEAAIKLRGELDDFEQELADINRVEHTIVDLVSDGHKPGDLKTIVGQGTPMQDLKTIRYLSPRQNRFDAAPPKSAARPVTKREGDAELILFSPVLMPTASGPASFGIQGAPSAFFPTRLPPTSPK